MVIGNAAQALAESESFGIAQGTLAELARRASRLPSTIHYFDDYHEVERQIRAIDPEWRICLNGHTTIFKVGSIESACRHVLHALAVVGLPSVPKGTESALGLLLAHPSLLQRTVAAALGGPLLGLSFVRTELATLAPHSGAADAARALLRAFARLAWFDWSEDDLHTLRQIRNPLALPKTSPVEDGAVLLSLAEQRDINEHLEEFAVGIDDHLSMPWQAIRAAVMLYWNYSNGLRPIQLAKLNAEDVRIRCGSPEHSTPSVVVRVPFAKQRPSRTKRFSVRRMRRTWTPIMAAWMETRSDPVVAERFDRSRSLFGLPPREISLEITRYVTQITAACGVPPMTCAIRPRSASPIWAPIA